MERHSQFLSFGWIILVSWGVREEPGFLVLAPAAHILKNQASLPKMGTSIKHIILTLASFCTTPPGPPLLLWGLLLKVWACKCKSQTPLWVPWLSILFLKWLAIKGTYKSPVSLPSPSPSPTSSCAHKSQRKNVHLSLSVITQTRKHPHVHQQVDGFTHSGISMLRDTIQQWKVMNYWYIQQHGEITT